MEHPNVQLAREGYDAFANGDLEVLAENLSPDAIWHVPGHSPLAGEYKGQEEIFGLFGKLYEISGGTIRLDVRDILANDDRVVCLVHMTAERGDMRLDQDSVHVFLVEDGKTKEFWSFDEDQRADDEFWS